MKTDNYRRGIRQVNEVDGEIPDGKTDENSYTSVIDTPSSWRSVASGTVMLLIYIIDTPHGLSAYINMLAGNAALMKQGKMLIVVRSCSKTSISCTRGANEVKWISSVQNAMSWKWR